MIPGGIARVVIQINIENVTIEAIARVTTTNSSNLPEKPTSHIIHHTRAFLDE